MASFIARKGPGGRRVWQTHIRRRGYPAQVRTFDKKSEAQAWAATVESEIARSVFVSRAEAEGTTLAEALDRYEREITPQKKSAFDERYKLNAWRTGNLSRRSLASIQGKDLAAWRDAEIRRGSSASTVRRKLALFSHLFEIARKEWGMESLINPVENIRLPPPGQSRTRRLVDNEETRLLTAAKIYGGEIRLIITWAIETAMRRGEISAMQWENLDRKAHVLLLPETKNGTSRRVPLSSRALAALDGLPRRIDGKVWDMKPDSISQAFERVCLSAGVEGLTFHDLRHEATSRLFERGLNPMEVAAITGHKTLQMLKRYTHLRAEDLVGRLG